MKKYESYKPIKQDFLDEIPLKWGLSKLKFVANLFNGDSLNQEEKEMFYESTGNSFPYISSKDINLNTHNIDYDNGLSISEKYLGKYKTCKAETTLICIEGGSAGRKIAFTNQPCTFVNKLCAIEGKDNSKYIYFYTQSNQFQAKFKLSISGLIGGVSISELKNFTIPVPPPLRTIPNRRLPRPQDRPDRRADRKDRAQDCPAEGKTDGPDQPSGDQRPGSHRADERQRRGMDRGDSGALGGK